MEAALCGKLYAMVSHVAVVIFSILSNMVKLKAVSTSGGQHEGTFSWLHLRYCDTCDKLGLFREAHTML